MLSCGMCLKAIELHIKLQAREFFEVVFTMAESWSLGSFVASNYIQFSLT